MRLPEDLGVRSGGTRFFFFFLGGGGGAVVITRAKLKNGSKMVNSVIFSFVFRVRLVSGVVIPTGNVPVPSPPHLAAMIVHNSFTNLDDLEDQITFAVDIIRQD